MHREIIIIFAQVNKKDCSVYTKFNASCELYDRLVKLWWLFAGLGLGLVTAGLDYIGLLYTT